ncbi:MAG: alpha/beta fold hydrolase, partial [Aliihoeflea sp.]
GSFTLHKALPRQFDSIIRLADSADLGEGYAAFDVQIVDADGILIAEIANFVVKRLANDLGFADAPEMTIPLGAVGRTSPVHAPLAAQVRNGILPQEGFEALVRALATGETQPIVSSMDLEALRVRASMRKADSQAPSQQFDRPELDEDYVAPRNEIETKLAEFWRELLGVGRVGVHDSFFDVGGHSLIAVRLFRMIRNQYGVDLPMSVLFEAPTISACATLLAEHGAGGDSAPAASQASVSAISRTVHLVPLHAGAANSAETPLFICAGMFGNVLNLRQLAMHVGRDRPVYALQARGLFGNVPPHETFEEMARDYLAEIRTVQPHGPYFLAGFSGGGITAYEMARQLDGAGEEVARLILLDTPLPTQPALSRGDLASMKLQDIQRDGLSFFSRWLRNRLRWEMERKQRREARSQAVSSETFHNAQIEAAFLRALSLYELKPYGGKVTLFRPQPDILYRLSGGRRLKEGRNFVFDDNGWTPFIDDFDVVVVSGDHDSMVLEPHVRMLADRIRTRLRGAMPSVARVEAAE